MQPSEAIEKLRKTSKDRNFKQTFDLIFSLRDVDMKKPENHIKTQVLLPHGRGKPVKVCCIVDKMVSKVKEISDTVVTKKELRGLPKDKKSISELVKGHEYFLAEVTLMVDVGKILGRYLGPKGKMPKPMPPNSDPKPLIERAKKSVRIFATNPTIQCGIGTEKMKDEEIEENLKTVHEEVVKQLPKGRNQIKNVYLKLTMSKPLEVTV